MYTKVNQEWLRENELELPKIENRYMAFAVKDLGVYKVLEKMNHELENPRYEIGFQFTKVNEKFIKEPHSDLLLFSADLVLPKSSIREETKVGLEKIGSIEEMNEDETHVTYSLQFHEGPNVHTMNEVVGCINEYLGPDIEKKLSNLGIKDYHCSFEIEKRCV